MLKYIHKQAQQDTKVLVHECIFLGLGHKHCLFCYEIVFWMYLDCILGEMLESCE